MPIFTGPENENSGGDPSSVLNDSWIMIEQPDPKATVKAKLKELEPGSDKAELAEYLSQELQAIGSRFDTGASGTYAWKFKTPQEALEKGQAREMNIVFLGTGSMPHFGAHQTISEGGDVLCHLALQKAVHENQPTFFIKGVGTAKLDSVDPTNAIDDADYHINSLVNPKSKHQGGAGGLGLGAGFERRIKITMEEFYLPNLLKMILKGNNAPNKMVIPINIIGHSRGAITSFYMADCIDKWLETVKTQGAPIDYQQLATVCNLSVEEVQKALKQIQDNKVDCHLNLLAFDPVEGKLKMGGTWIQGSTDTKVTVNVANTLLQPNCSTMPSRVHSAEVYIAEAERRLDFRPTIPEFAPNTHVNYKVQVGNHSTMTGNIGNDDGDGQDAYPSIKDHPFAKEAALASIDKVKLDSNHFLFGDHLPPLPRHTLRRIFRSNPDEKQFAYQNTLEFLERYLKSNYHNNKELQDYIAQSFPDPLKCCEWLMKRDQKFTQRAYFLMEKDIHDMYLAPKDPKQQEILSAWQQDLKKDSSTLLYGPITGKKYALPLQSPSEEREIYLRSGINISSHKIYNTFSDHHGSSGSFPIGGKNAFDQFSNPYHCVLTDLLSIDPKTLSDELLDLNILFAKVNDVAVKNAQYIRFNPGQSPNAASNQTKLIRAIEEFAKAVEQSSLDNNKKIEAISWAIDRVSHTKTLSPEQIRNIILKFTKGDDHQRLEIHHLKTEAKQEIMSYLVAIKKDINNYIASYNLISSANPNSLLFIKTLEDLMKQLNPHNIDKIMISLNEALVLNSNIKPTQSSYTYSLINWAAGITLSAFSTKLNASVEKLKPTQVKIDDLLAKIQQLEGTVGIRKSTPIQ